MTRRRRRDDRPIPAHPYRDTAILYGIMAAVLVAVASLTGGDQLRALAVAGAFFVVATTWTCWRFRARIKERDAALTASTSAQRSEGQPNGNGRGSAGG